MDRCVSCDAALTGRYCAQCGEKTLGAADLDWRHYLLHELPHAIFEVDGALPRTLTSLFVRPGELAQAFVSGRRRAFIPPVRLYVLAFLLYELTRSIIGHGHHRLDVGEWARLVDQTGTLKTLIGLRPASFWQDPAREARLAEAGRWLSEAGTFLVASVLAMLQSLVFIKLKRRYLEHLALALNVTTFFLLCAAIGQLIVLFIPETNSANTESNLQTVLALFALPIYWFFGVKRFYGLGALWAGVSAVAMTVGIAVIASILNTLALLVLIVAAPSI